MHNHFLDKGRRHLRLQPDQVDLILPEHFAASYPKFLQILEAYYEFQEEEKATELLHHIFATRDITETDITLLSYIEDELLLGDAYFESFATGEAQKRAAANFSNTLFKSKGTKFAIQWFFRSFFGLDAEIVETQNQIFKLNEPESGIGVNSLKFLTDDKLYQTFAYLVRCSVPINEWKDLFKLFVHPAGMYLGGELLVTDQVFAELLTLDSDNIVTQANTPVIQITTTDLSESEGTTFEFSITGTDTPDLVTYNYYLELLDSTTTDDFAFSADSTFPDSDNKRLFNIVNDSATIRIPTLHDSVEGEGNQRFRLFVSDLENRIAASQTVTMEDVIASYTMTPSATLIDEGDSVQFSVTGSSVPNNGNTTLFYQIIPEGTDSTGDFVSGSFPSSGIVTPFFIRDDSGSFSIQTKIDGTAEGREHFSVKLLTESMILKDSVYISVDNVAPTFTLTPSPTVFVTEGDDLAINLVVDQTTIGTTIDYVVDAGDDRIVNRTGSFEITAANQDYTLTPTSVSDTFDEPPSIALTLTTNSGGFFSPELSDAIVVEVQNKPAEFLNVTTDVLTAGNGDTVVFTVSGTNIKNSIADSSGKYFIDHIDTVDGDFSVAPPTDSASAEGIPFTSNSGSVSLTFTDTGDTDNEQFDFVVLGGADSEVFRRPFIITNNTYTATVTATPLDEDETVEVTFTTDDVSQTTYYYYVEGTNITSDDFTSGFATSASRGTVVTAQGGGDGIITLDLNEDNRREGTETFRVYISASASGGVLTSTSDISIADTSLPVYTLSLPDITEGDTLTATVTPLSQNPTDFSENLYVEFYTTTAADSVSLGDATPPSQTMSVGAGAKDFICTTSANSVAQADRTIRANARIGGYDGTVVAFDTCTVTDAVPSYSLTTNQVNDSADEGDTIQFTFGGTNVPSGTYYYNVTDIKPKELQENLPGNANLLFKNDDIDLTGVIEVGQEVREVDFPVNTTVSSVFDNSGAGDFVNMSEDNTETSNIPDGTIAYFAPSAVFDDFDTTTNKPYGSFTHTTGVNSTFNVNLNTDGDIPPSGRTESYTMQVTTDPEEGSVVSRPFTIGDDTQNPVPNVQRGSLLNPESVLGIGENENVATSSVEFRNTGVIAVKKTLTDGTTDTTTLKGFWVDDTGAGFDPSDFKITASKVDFYNPVGTQGSYGTDLNLGTTQIFEIETSVPSSSTVYGFRYITFTISEIANPTNAVTTEVRLLNTTTYDPPPPAPGPGPGDPGPGFPVDEV